MISRFVPYLALGLIAAGLVVSYYLSPDWKSSKPTEPGLRLGSGIGATPFFDAAAAMKRVNNYELDLKRFALANKCNQQYGFLIDMRIPSYRNRFFVYDLKKDSVIDAGLVAHGLGSQPRGRFDDLIFSNTPESRCTSLGKYKIGVSYMGKYGYSYRMAGLDTSNSNAMKRAIVLHGHNCIPNKEDTVNGWPICYSYGCPMVSLSFLQRIKSYVKKQGKQPILLWIFY